MSTPEDCPPVLHRWLAPPRRALLTWVALAGISGALDDRIGVRKIQPMLDWTSDLLDRHLPFPMPAAAGQLVFIIDTVLFFTWFEPVMLRLNLRRGAAWLVLRSALLLTSEMLAAFHGMALDAAIYLLWGAATVPVLRGWRSRPWTSIIGAALSWVMLESIKKLPETPPSWIGVAVVPLPYAAVMLYGTRALRSELDNGGPSTVPST